MTTLFRILIDTAGLSLAQASEFLDARFDTIQSWSSGRRVTPPGVIAELQDLISRQQIAAQQAAVVILKKIKKRGLPETIEIGIAADDHEAQSLGWPVVSAHAAVIGVTLALLPHDIVSRIAVVPRGSTAASAAAADQH